GECRLQSSDTDLVLQRCRELVCGRYWPHGVASSQAMQWREEQAMKFGFNAPTAGHLAVPDALMRIVVEGEKMGFDYCTISDHVIIPRDIHARYPYSETGEFPAGARLDRHEQLIEVAWLAAKTTKLRLVLSVMVVPHRPAVLAAKQLADIDIFSGGRLTVGIGAGWM